MDDIIEKYTRYVRNLSEFDDEDIKTAMANVAKEDDEVISIIEKFLQKTNKLNDNLISVGKNKCERSEDNDKTIKDILNIFAGTEYAYLLDELITSLKILGYSHPGEIIADSIDYLLYVDSIDDDGSIYFALTEYGNLLWETF